MSALSIFRIPAVSRACGTPRNERTKFQQALVGVIKAWLHFKGRMPWNAQKYDIPVFRGQSYHESLCGFRTWVLYDRGGYLYGWYGQDRDDYPFFTPAAEVHGETRHRMHWLSRFISGTLPAGNQAEVIGSDGTVVGHTTYKSS